MNIIKRSEWDNSSFKPKYTKHKPSGICLHHSATPTTAQWKGIQTVRSILGNHTAIRKFSDIGYHFIISPDGQNCYECRPVDVQGAHCGGTPPKGVSRVFGNTGMIGICLIGNYDTEEPSRVAMDNIARLIADLCEKHGIDTKRIYGHCEAWSKPPKTCPGKKLFTAMFGENRWKALKF